MVAITKSKEGEKCRPSEEHLETSIAALGGAGDQLERKVKELCFSVAS